MTIKFFEDRIEFANNITLSVVSDGLFVNGNVTASRTFVGSQITTPSAFGSSYGFTSGGAAANPSPPQIGVTRVDRFPFAIPTVNATSVGDLIKNRFDVTGQSSKTHGYTSGGYLAQSGSYVSFNIIERFPFSTPFALSSDVAFLSSAVRRSAGQSSATHGYSSGGFNGPAINNIFKFPFATNGSSTSVGTLTQARHGASGQSSTTHGYTSGGSSPLGNLNTIDKFPFSTDSNATDVGDLTSGRERLAGQSSTTHGYTSNSAGINKFSFASDGNATSVGNLSVPSRNGAAGQSSTTHGYTSGGYNPPNVRNVIDRFPFSVDSSATDVGDLSQGRYFPAGQQV